MGKLERRSIDCSRERVAAAVRYHEAGAMQHRLCGASLAPGKGAGQVEIIGDSRTLSLDGEEWSAIINTADLDAHNSIVHPEGADFTRFYDNPIVYYDHGYLYDQTTLPIGAAVSIGKTKSGIESAFYLARGVDPADAVGELMRQGVLRGVSIGFFSTKIGFEKVKGVDIYGDEMDDEIMHIYEWQLYEYSVVGVPSNPKALLKSAVSAYEKRLKSVTYPDQRSACKAHVAHILDLQRRGASTGMLAEACSPILEQIYGASVKDLYSGIKSAEILDLFARTMADVGTKESYAAIAALIACDDEISQRDGGLGDAATLAQDSNELKKHNKKGDL